MEVVKWVINILCEAQEKCLDQLQAMKSRLLQHLTTCTNIMYTLDYCGGCFVFTPLLGIKFAGQRMCSIHLLCAIRFLHFPIEFPVLLLSASCSICTWQKGVQYACGHMRHALILNCRNFIGVPAQLLHRSFNTVLGWRVNLDPIIHGLYCYTYINYRVGRL